MRERLVLLAAGKLAETRHSIAELRALEAGLTDLYQQLDAWRRSRHLRPGCGCPDQPLTIEPAPPAACPLPSGQVPCSANHVHAEGRRAARLT